MGARVRRAVIPAGGKGTRLYPLSRFYPKELIPVGDRAALQWTLEEALAAGIREIGVIVRPGKPALKEYLDRRKRSSAPMTIQEETLQRLLDQIRLEFLVQPEPLGLGDAITAARDFVRNEPFALLLPDNLFDGREPAIGTLVDVHERFGGVVLGCQRRSGEVPVNEAPFAYEPADESGVAHITRFEEKGAPPLSREEAPWGDLRGVGRAIFPPEYLDVIEALRGRVPGELDDIRPLAHLLRTTSTSVWGRILDAPRYDVGDFTGLRAAQEAFLNHWQTRENPTC